MIRFSLKIHLKQIDTWNDNETKFNKRTIECGCFFRYTHVSHYRHRGEGIHRVPLSVKYRILRLK